MFVRFRAGRRRLALSLVETRRVDGQVKHEHIATLGSVETPLTIRARIAFWTKLNGRLAALGNRVAADQHHKIYGAVAARIPMVTPDEQRGIQTENAKDDERFWDAMRDINAATAEEHRGLIAAAEAKKAKHEAAAAEARERLEAAKARLAALERGESIAGGLGKKLDISAMAKAAGLTARDIRQARLYASLTPAEFETALNRERTVAAVDRAMNREIRRVLRERSE